MITPSIPFHVGFTGTRHGLSQAQGHRVASIVDEACRALRGRDVIAHHGLCVGADEDFHAIMRERGWHVIGHPGPDWPDGPLCAYTICGNTVEPLPHMKRNAAIVAASHIMIAAPLESTPQPRGGTWATICMALRALRAGKLQALYVVGRNGELLDHGGWR